MAINPGSTSTKIAVYANDENIFLKNIKHSANELKPFATVADQFSFRKEVILKELGNAGIELNSITAIVGRGGLLRSRPSRYWL